MSTLDEQLADAMHQHVGDVHPAADLLTSVRAGGQRRARRRRFETIAGGVLSLALIGGTVFTVARSADRSTAQQPAGELAGFDGPTKGDLATDQAYLAAVVSAWDASHATSANANRGLFDDLLGRARVLWAGTTPAGPAAVVAQDAELHKHDDLSDEDVGPATLIGFVGVNAGGKPRVVGDTYPSDGVPMTGWWVDEAHTVLAAVTNGESVGYSTGWAYMPDGRVRRTPWQPLLDADGVAVATVPTGAKVILARQPFATFDDVRVVAGNPPYDLGDDTRLNWRPVGGQDILFPVGTPSGLGTPTAPRLRTALSKAFNSATDPLLEPAATLVGYGFWYAYGKTPDGRELVVSEKVIDGEPSRPYAVLTGPTGSAVRVGGPIDVHAPLPVALRLPDSQGWVVASYLADLRFRLPGGAWTAHGKNAAILPDAAEIEVEVTRAGAEPVVVRLRELSGLVGVGAEVITAPTR